MSVLFEAFWPVIPTFFGFILILLLISIYINRKFGYRLNTYKKLRDFVLFVGMMMSVIGILLITLMPTNIEGHTLNVAPFQSMKELYYYGTDEAIINNIGMNIVLFIPLGFFIYLITEKDFLTSILGCLLSISIETLQYILPLGRTTNIDDVILNVVGTLIGILIAYFFKKVEIFIIGYISRDNS
ncbi:VanZ family protein [Nosocomiicoccus ampullae]|uniref:Glycopeptide antibiotics resistance protein n=1 Tax=Nosocomiicoccus ampullae TaxID=489910 RepID=A0A9Q2D0B5_9STAP|nr:VanZ family protein [Nosocomiicoccus ampullae]MBB5176512.1 glycopeptide antibiotics resistance protein [Nosocomiicoccus ampullae]QYA46550.1 VanZ family protein [Nosocomiicoccus ampullae]QYA48135.1 VanZ family protein [Nosocomiicoccus ampullae]